MSKILYLMSYNVEFFIKVKNRVNEIYLCDMVKS